MYHLRGKIGSNYEQLYFYEKEGELLLKTTSLKQGSLDIWQNIVGFASPVDYSLYEDGANHYIVSRETVFKSGEKVLYDFWSNSAFGCFFNDLSFFSTCNEQINKNKGVLYNSYEFTWRTNPIWSSCFSKENSYDSYLYISQKAPDMDTNSSWMPSDGKIEVIILKRKNPQDIIVKVNSTLANEFIVTIPALSKGTINEEEITMVIDLLNSLVTTTERNVSIALIVKRLQQFMAIMAGESLGLQDSITNTRNISSALEKIKFQDSSVINIAKASYESHLAELELEKNLTKADITGYYKAYPPVNSACYNAHDFMPEPELVRVRDAISKKYQK